MATSPEPQSSLGAGRLIVFQGMDQNALDLAMNSATRFNGFLSIAFPAMPASIELARRAEYAVQSPWGFPDGMHFYKGTSVLKIPFSFTLKNDDRTYCPQGSKTLLQIAAALHALVLPIGKETQSVSYDYRSQIPPGSEGDQKKTAALPTEATGYNLPPGVNPPATCYLELIVTERDSVGVACVGYIEEVKVALRGPFLKGQGIAKNLPTFGDFSFTFVHHPGHVNNYTPNQLTVLNEQQAYASTVKKNFYNTVNLLTTGNGFVGIP